MELRKLDFVKQQLSLYSGPKKILNSASTFVCCPYHSEKTPSFRIFHSLTTKSPGWGRCYGCGKSAPWDEFADKLSLRPYTYAKPTEQFVQSPIFQEEEIVEEEELEFSDLPKNKVWRSIKTNLLIEAGCKMVTNRWGTKFIYLPVVILGEERGHIKARLKKVADKPSYINKKGKWSQDQGLFLYDFACRSKPNAVVLVEGPRDALRLNMLGVPAIAILGTQSWTDRKSRLLSLCGAENVVLMMDGDCAGIRAEEKIRSSLGKLVNVHTFKLYGKDSPYHKFRNEDEPTKAAKAAGVELWDPGNCPLSKVRELKSFLRELTVHT